MGNEGREMLCGSGILAGAKDPPRILGEETEWAERCSIYRIVVTVSISKFIGQIRKHNEDTRSFTMYKHGKQKS